MTQRKLEVAAIIRPEFALPKDVSQAKDNNEALIEASKQGITADVERLLGEGADVNARDALGCTPLIWAATNRHLQVAMMLLDHRADVNAATDEDGFTGLIGSCANGHTELVKLLVENQADIFQKDKRFEAPPFVWAASGDSVMVLELLINKGVDVNCTAKNGETALMGAALEGYLAEVQYLVKMGANINAKNKDNETALKLALIFHNMAVAKYLKDHGGEE